jgi:nicotinamide-nucleotide amidase
MIAPTEGADPGDRTERLAQRLGVLLIRAGKRIAAAESLTAGHVQMSIAAVSGSSRYFIGGITAYQLDGKVGLLGVDRVEAERADCVSAEVARQMARGAQRVFGTEVGIGTTGYADGVDMPFAYLAVVDGDTEAVERFEGPGLTRREMQYAAANRVLELAIQSLEAPHDQ